MNRIILSIALLLLKAAHPIYSQSITNVQAKVEGSTVVVSYQLQSSNALEISLYVSEDSGRTFVGPLKSVRGDVGKGIQQGSRRIVWDVLNEREYLHSSKMVFRVEASYRFGTFRDPRDGKTYKTVKIGNQVWMAENLAYLPSVNMVADGSEDAAGSYYYVYGYDGTNVADAKATDNYATYGVLYNWTAAMDGEASSTTNPSGIQGVCPAGWHVPSDAEWTELTDYLGGPSDAGGKLKETGTTHWYSPNTSATNETGFTALPGGDRYYNGTFDIVGYDGYWWSATEYKADYAWYRTMSYYVSNVYRNFSSKELGFSVRCLRD